MEERRLADQGKSRRLFGGVLLGSSSLLAAAATGLWTRERRRQAAEMALLKANADLESQAGELRGHREHLMELVEERTVGLSTANLALQKEVAERKEAEEALRKSEELYRMLVETMNEGVMILDDKGVFTFVNDKFCEMLGYSRGELLGRRGTDFLSGADGKVITDHLLRSRGQNQRLEVTITKKNGDKVFTIVSPRAIYDRVGGWLGGFALITDITEKVAWQAESLRTAHLVSLGEMAAGVAHEINNPINGIINYARILCNSCDEGRRGHEIPNRILKEGRRIADIVRALLLFARGGMREKTPVRLRDILSDALGLMGSEMRGEGIQIPVDLPPDLPEMIADPREIQQVFMNILSNARYALNQRYPGPHEEKRLRIQAERVIIDDSPYVRIAFHDRGVGIPAGIIEKIMEPFFSTKPRGKGTGLGLSISDGIIRDHGGTLTIESVEGEGTTVEITLPVWSGSEGSPAVKREAAQVAG